MTNLLPPLTLMGDSDMETVHSVIGKFIFRLNCSLPLFISLISFVSSRENTAVSYSSAEGI